MSGLVLPRSVVERERAIAIAMMQGAVKQAAIEAGLSVCRVERAVRFNRPTLERLLYLNARHRSPVAFDTRTGKLHDPA